MKIISDHSASAGEEEIVLEAIPDLSTDIDFPVKLCRIQVRRAGEGMPCIIHGDVQDK